MLIQQKLISIPQRENAGSITSDRLGYQINWALCKIMDLHTGASEYVVGLELYDDVLIFVNPDNPSNLDFYQIKTKRSGSWSALSLSSIAKKTSSIISKMHDHIINFNDDVSTINFVSNAPFKFKMKDDSKSDIKDKIFVEKISEQDLKCLKDSIEKSTNSACSDRFEKVAFFEKSNLGLTDHHNSTTGKLALFLEQINSGKYKIPLIYSTIVDELKRKNDYVLPPDYSFEELIKKKCIKRSDFDKIINVFINSSNETEEGSWEKLEKFLINDGYNFLELKPIRSSFNKYKIDCMSKNFLLEQLINKIRDIYTYTEDNGMLDVSSLKKCISTIYEEYVKNEIKNTYFDEHYIKTVILDILINYEQKTQTV